MQKPSVNITLLEKLSDDNKKQLKDLHRQAFDWISQMSPEERKEHNEKFCSQKDVIEFVLATADDKLVGIVTIYKRFILFSSRPISLGGLGGVAVDEDYRRQGIATQMLEKALQELENLNADVAFLCTNINKLGKLYESVGFKKLDKKYTYLSSTGKRYTEKDGMLAPIKSKEVFKLIINSKEPFDIGVGNW